MLLSKLLRPSFTLLEKNKVLQSVRFGHGYTGYREPNYQHNLIFQKKLAYGISTFMWVWIFWHIFHEYEHLIGEFPEVDKSKWTDEHLGVPPDEEGLAPVKENVRSILIPGGPLRPHNFPKFVLQNHFGESGCYEL